MIFMDGSSMINILSYISNNELSKISLETSIINKFVVCSSDTEYVKKRILNKDVLQNIRLCEKPLNIDYLKSII